MSPRRVINVLKSLVQDGDLADQPEVLDEIAQFAASVVSVVPVSKTLLVLVDRAVRDYSSRTHTSTDSRLWVTETRQPYRPHDANLA
jgi:hypothetical protein